ncbi:uncharacterized protein LOC127716091 [Mytilus californianus]|uniref:uncharacterized protein LOC127716091 n=1 Tax=Mytilus californianus TaxID=6549 RepID=UPI00224712E1|nr:uncharacterized protein LOC127716091 [Mytilus californianus]
MDQAYYERISRQKHVRTLLQKAVLNLCQKNYATCAPNLEVDGIICISFPDSPDQHVVKIHEKIQLNDFRTGLSCSDAAVTKVHRSPNNCNNGQHMYVVRNNESDEVVEDRDSMQSSYLDVRNENSLSLSPGSSVFPKMESVSSLNNKQFEGDVHSSKSKRKMFKVVQRKRNTIEEPDVVSDSSDEDMNVSKDQESSKSSPRHSANDTIGQNQSPNGKKTNFCESVKDGYVIVKVENFDDEGIDDSKHGGICSDKNNKHEELGSDSLPSRKWIQLPSQDENESSYSKGRESLITIEGHLTDNSAHESPNRNSNNKDIHFPDTDGYQVRPSVGQIDLSKTSGYCGTSPEDKHLDSFSYRGKDTQFRDSSSFSNLENVSCFPPFTRSLLETRALLNKGTKSVDNLLMNKCKKDQLSAHESSFRDRQSMIDLQSTSTASEKKSPLLSYSIALNTDKEKKYFCKHCGKGFTLKCTRSRHEKTICGGGGEGQYRCHICLKVFTRSDSRCRHLWKTHGVKNEVTTMC